MYTSSHAHLITCTPHHMYTSSHVHLITCTPHHMHISSHAHLITCTSHHTTHTTSGQDIKVRQEALPELWPHPFGHLHCQTSHTLLDVQSFLLSRAHTLNGRGQDAAMTTCAQEDQTDYARLHHQCTGLMHYSNNPTLTSELKIWDMS